MMGPRQVDQAALVYEFSLERHVPATHLLRSIDRFVDLSDVRSHLAPFYSSAGRPSVFHLRQQHMTKMPLAEHDNVVKAFPSDRTDQPFSISVLPWGARRRRSIANAD